MSLGSLSAVLERLEDGFSLLVLVIMSGMLISEIVAREWFGSSIPGSVAIVQHMTLWVTFLGAALAARSDRLLALSMGTYLPERWRRGAKVLSSLLAVGVTSCLFLASVHLTQIDYAYGDTVAWGIPIWVFSAIMPLGCAMIVGRLIRHAAAAWSGRALAAVGLCAPLLFWLVPDPQVAGWILPVTIVILIGTALGMPIYAALGGVALLLFWDEGTPISAVPGETYRMSTAPMLPAIPLFTLAGYILSAGGSSRRLLSLCSALVGWMPGGLAVVVTLVLAFFTPLTGASGITILAMGGLLLPMMLEARYSERDAVGLVTVSGSIGVLFPPSLPVILYAYYAELTLDRLFIAGLLPGLVLVAVVAAWGAWSGWHGGAVRSPFQARKLGIALWEAKWDIMIPVVTLTSIFGGFATLVEAAALTVLYAIVVEYLVYRELSVTRDTTRVAIESATMVGGFMIILGVALGLTNYLIIAQIPMHALAWVQEFIHAPALFLLALNVLLIVVGALMDIYSAIIVIVPLIAPMAAAYGIDPIHLGIIFLANMQLGYLMPPMGENLFLSAYRFDQPLARIYQSAFPYVVILLCAVLLITYVPAITLCLLTVFGV
jgi:tripartite ATP-independent transporter DctM subunit